MSNAVAVYSFRTTCATYELDALLTFCKKYGKEWEFQKEQGDTGYVHYQGGISLFKKRRETEIKKLIMDSGDKLPEYFKPSADPKATMNYCNKHDTRIEGPWSSKTMELYIPRQYRGLLDKLYPYQQYIFDTATHFDTRTINLIYCQTGNKGKSTIASICELFANGIDLPPVNDADKIIQSCCDIAMAKEVRNPSPIFIDMPRAMFKDRLNGVYTAIEQIKKGKLYDLRNRYKEWWIDSPAIWVFSNAPPDIGMLSRDRWKLWTIDEHHVLQPYESMIDELEHKQPYQII